MKRTKIILLATLGICILSFMPSVLGAAESRPISAFTDTNPNVAAWADPESGLTVFPHGFYLFGLNGLESIAECDHHGSVLVKDLKDGRILYKINLHVKGASMFITNATTLIFVGEMDYTFTATVIVYEGELGDPVPYLLAIWFPDLIEIEPIGEGTFSHITGGGTGTFIDDYAAIRLGFTPGATAKAKVNQVGILKPEDHPSYDGVDFMMWPVEFVFIH